MAFNIPYYSMKNYENKIVDIHCMFHWRENKHDQGYEITIISNKLEFKHYYHDSIARVKHLSQQKLENITIMNGKTLYSKRPHSKCVISPIP